MSVNGRKSAGVRSVEVKRVAIYTRKSTAIGLDQEFNSLDAQREACEQYVKHRAQDGWKIVDERYDDGGFSGANIDRPAFQRLLKDVEDRKIDIIVVYKVDRLSRSLLDFAQLMDQFNRQNVAFVSVTQNFSTADAMGRLTLNMLMSFAEFEREMIAERTRDKIAAARRRGKWTGGKVPLGYEVVDRKLQVNTLESLLVQDIFELYEFHHSSILVTGILNGQGRTTKRYKTKTGKVLGGKEWTKDAVLRVLKNCVYAGYMPYGNERFEGEHEPIIDRKRFHKVERMLARCEGNGKRYPTNPDYLLRGILRCGRCNALMTPASTRKGDKVYRYYRCGNRDKKGKEACQARQIPAIAIEDFVAERIRQFSMDSALAKQIGEKLDDKIRKLEKRLEKEREKLPKRIAELAAEGRELLEKAGELTGDAARVPEKCLDDVGEHLAEAENRLSNVEYALDQLPRIDAEKTWVTTTVERFDSIWETMSPLNRGRLVKLLVKKVVVDEKKGTVTAILTDLDLPDLEDGFDDDEHPAGPACSKAAAQMEAIP